MASDMQEMLNSALTGDFGKAKQLLEGGLGINDIIVLTDKSAGPHAQLEVTALHVAVMISRTEMVQFVLANGADVTSRDGKGRSPLELAKDQEIVQLLERQERTQGTMAQIHDAADRGDVAQVKKLLAAGANANAPAEDGWPPLNIAAMQGHAAVAECLIQNGANVNSTSPGEFRPLFTAAQGGHLAVVELLVAKGAEIDARSNDGGTALYNAALNGHPGVVGFLIGAGAEVDARAKNGGTPLGVAVEQGHLAVVRILVDKGAKIDAASTEGFTPLHMAAQKGHKEIANFLLEHGANVDARNKAGSTPDDIAHLHGHPDLVKLIAGKRVQKPGGGTYCSKCGRGVIMSWTCPKCSKLLCDTCSGLTKTKPQIHGGFTTQTLGGGIATCPFCVDTAVAAAPETAATQSEKKWWQFWK